MKKRIDVGSSVAIQSTSAKPKEDGIKKITSLARQSPIKPKQTESRERIDNNSKLLSIDTLSSRLGVAASTSTSDESVSYEKPFYSSYRLIYRVPNYMYELNG